LKAARPDWLPDPIPPEGETERRLARLRRAVLDVETVGRADDFFAMGGHSLAASRLTAALRDDLQVELPLQQIYEHPVLADLAAAIDRLAGGGEPARTGIPLEKMLQYLDGF
jgi:acyl carrier protein